MEDGIVQHRVCKHYFVSNKNKIIEDRKQKIKYFFR